MKAYRKRIVDELLADKLEAKGAVVITGPKWCGKTTTALQTAGSVLRMDNPATRDENIQMSEINPSQLLTGTVPRLIDEWQLAPRIWDAVRYEVDERGDVGQFILTSSAVPVDSKKITHSGTGRFSWLTMRPMSLYESGESSGEVSLGALFDAPESIGGASDMDIDRLAYLICRGGGNRHRLLARVQEGVHGKISCGREAQHQHLRLLYTSCLKLVETIRWMNTADETRNSGDQS